MFKRKWKRNKSNLTLTEICFKEGKKNARPVAVHMPTNIWLDALWSTALPNKENAMLHSLFSNLLAYDQWCEVIKSSTDLKLKDTLSKEPWECILSEALITAYYHGVTRETLHSPCLSACMSAQVDLKILVVPLFATFIFVILFFQH